LRRQPLAVLVATLWLAAVGAGVGALEAYSNRAGSSGAPPAWWPRESQIGLGLDRPTLVLIAHPRCPCTRATIGELEVLLAQSQGRLQTHVLFIQPPGMTNDWVQTDLWRQASQLPGVTVSRDIAGVEARRFHSHTSGHVLLYDRHGRLSFHGGITASRGHAGDNPGRSAIRALLKQQSSTLLKTPVFGCPLFSAKPTQECAACTP
jgi:hypothetical protein